MYIYFYTLQRCIVIFIRLEHFRMYIFFIGLKFYILIPDYKILTCHSKIFYHILAIVEFCYNALYFKERNYPECVKVYVLFIFIGEDVRKSL